MKENNDILDIIKVKNFYSSKDTNTSEKMSKRAGEDICNVCVRDKEIIYRIKNS